MGYLVDEERKIIMGTATPHYRATWDAHRADHTSLIYHEVQGKGAFPCMCPVMTADSLFLIANMYTEAQAQAFIRDWESEKEEKSPEKGENFLNYLRYPESTEENVEEEAPMLFDGLAERIMERSKAGTLNEGWLLEQLMDLDLQAQNCGSDVSAHLLKIIAVTGERTGVFGGEAMENAARAILKLHGK